MATGSLETGSSSTTLVRAEISFLQLDGLRRTRPSGAPEVVLCALGLTREGATHALALRVVRTESEQAWRALLQDLATDGIGPDLLLICSDGHPALVKAIHAVYPETPQQISVAHRLLALARKVDARWRAACLAEARAIFAAPDRAAAVTLFRDWHTRWLKQGEFAVRSLEADLASCLTFYRFPPALWSKIRTVNLVERVFREARRSALPAAPRGSGSWEEGTAAPVPEEQRETTPPDGAEIPAAVSALAEDVPAPRVSPGPPPARAEGPAEALLLHVSHLREAEAVVLHLPWVEEAKPEAERGAVLRPDDGPPRAASASGARAPDGLSGSRGPLNLTSDEAFEDWLQTYRREAFRAKVVISFTCVAGLLAGIAISLSR